MASWLGRLFRYRETEAKAPGEDFFTEALTGVLNANPEMCAGFAGWLACQEFSGARAITQKPIGGGRVDMWIEARDAAGRRHVVVVENKLGAPEGQGQLGRYEVQLAQETAATRTLVYITMHERTDFGRSESAVSFRNLHWFQVYEWITRWTGGRGELAGQLLELMEEWGMEMHLGAHDLGVAVAYQGRVQKQMLQIPDEVYEKCRADCRRGQWAYDRLHLGYRSAYLGDEDVFYDFGFDFERDEERWNAARLQLPSAYFGLRGADAAKLEMNRLSEGKYIR